MESAALTESAPTRAECEDFIRRQAASGMSIAKFCAGEGIKEQAFYRWKRQLGGPRLRAKSTNRSAEFVEVAGQAEQPILVNKSAWSVELTLPSGVTLRVR